MGVILTDNFARVAGSLGANWTQLLGGFAVNNGAKGSFTSPPFNVAKYSASSFALNQQLSFVTGNIASDLQGVAFRLVDLGGGAYSYYILIATSSGMTLYKIVGSTASSNGAVTNFGSYTNTINAGDTITLACIGPNIVAFHGTSGTPAVLNIVDSALAGTACGLFQNGNTDVIHSWSAIDFIPPVGTQLNVICDGDSKTWGQGVSNPWPSLLVLNVAPNNVNNFGVDGQKLSDMVTYAPTYIDPMFTAGAINICIPWAGTNDAANGASAATIFSNLQTYCAARRAVGFRTIAVPMLSAPGIDTIVQQFNALLAANPQIADATAYLPSFMTGPQAYSNPAYFDGSGHPTQLGHSILASYLSQTINSLAPDLFLGSIQVVGSAPVGASDHFLGTINVLGSAPAGRNNPYLGKVRVVSAPGAEPQNPTLGSVVLVGSTPPGAPDNYLGNVTKA